MSNLREKQLHQNHMLSIEAEEYLLGSILIDSGAMLAHEALKIIDVADIYRGDYRTLFNAMLECETDGKEPHQINVANKLYETGKMDEILNCSFLSHLVRNCPTPLSWEDYAKTILELSQERNPNRVSMPVYKGAVRV